jgi:hypothetical protein
MMRRTCTLFTSLAILSGCALTVPSDEDLIAHFRDHESDFAEIVEMLKTDTEVSHLSFDSVSPDGAVDDRRWEAYKKIMKKAGVGSVHACWEERPGLPEISFHTHASHYNLDYDKGYAFSRRVPSPLAEDLDIAIKEIPSYGVSYRHIKGNWYIYLQNMTE